MVILIIDVPFIMFSSYLGDIPWQGQPINEERLQRVNSALVPQRAFGASFGPLVNLFQNYDSYNLLPQQCLALPHLFGNCGSYRRLAALAS